MKHHPMPCYCGHDCARCVIYHATRNDEEALRLRAKRFYEETFGVTLDETAFHCLGGRTETRFALCRTCPFRACAEARGLTFCKDCADYPCARLAEYEKRYVNRCLRLDE